MTDCIRKAVELADGFEADDVNNYYWYDPGYGEGFDGFAVDQHDPDQWFLAALAADLVDMVDGLDKCHIESGGIGQANIWHEDAWNERILIKGPDRRMNTIHAVVAFYEAHPELAGG